MGDNAEEYKHGATECMLPSTMQSFAVHQIVVNVRKSNVNQCSYKLVGKSARRTFRECIRVFEIIATAEISIFVIDQRNLLFYVLQ